MLGKYDGARQGAKGCTVASYNVNIMANIMKGAAKRAKSYFSKVAALNETIDIGGHIGMAARKDKRKMSDTWVKRNSTKPGQFFNRAEARAAKRNQVTITKG